MKNFGQNTFIVPVNPKSTNFKTVYCFGFVFFITLHNFLSLTLLQYFYFCFLFFNAFSQNSLNKLVTVAPVTSLCPMSIIFVKPSFLIMSLKNNWAATCKFITAASLLSYILPKYPSSLYPFSMFFRVSFLNAGCLCRYCVTVHPNQELCLGIT